VNVSPRQPRCTKIKTSYEGRRKSIFAQPTI